MSAPDFFLKVALGMFGTGAVLTALVASISRNLHKNEYLKQKIFPSFAQPLSVEIMVDSLAEPKPSIASSPYILALSLLMGYFRPNTIENKEELEKLLHEDEHAPRSAEERWQLAKDNLRAFSRASAKVPSLYALPPLFFLLTYSILDISAPRLLRNRKLSAAWSYHFRRLSSDFADPRWIRDFTLDVRPLLLTWACIGPLTAMLMMLAHFLRTAFGPLFSLLKKNDSKESLGMPCLRLSQNLPPVDQTKAVSFYNTPWFNIVVLLPFIIGVPGAITSYIFVHQGVDAIFGYPMSDPGFHRVITVIQWYIAPLSWCLCALFFRSYFTFAWNFTSTEYDIEVYPDLIESLPIKGWFMDFITLRSMHMPQRIEWEAVNSIKYSSGRLPLDLPLMDHPWLAFIGRLASVYESISKKLDINNEFLEIKTKSKTMQIRLWELTSKQKLELFHCLRKYAPSVYLNDQVQQALVGSSVLKEPKYTEIWFSILNSEIHPREGELSAGQTLRNGEYQILSQIASGGQAVIYRAQKNDGQVIVLKEFQLTPGESFDATIESARPFETESSILSRLDHPAIVKMLDLFYEGGRVYIVLESVDGTTLRNYVKEKGTLAANEVLSLAKQMCEMLAYLHNQIPPVVHRDFTPENIILTTDGKLKLIDFSIAEHKDKRADGDCAGKHAYTPPEQFRGEACPASDIYALGATLYFLITGSDPVPITSSDLKDHNINDDLKNIVRTATALDLEKRYESVQWLLADVNRALGGSTTANHGEESNNSTATDEGSESIKLNAEIKETI